MLVKIVDNDLAKQLLKDGKASSVNIFDEYYNEEVDGRINYVKDGLKPGHILEEDEARKYLSNNIPYTDYDSAYNYLVEKISNFVYESSDDLSAFKFVVPGECEYVMKAVGKKESIEKLVDRLNSEADDYSAERHFYNIKYNTSLSEAQMVHEEDDIYSFDMIGVCKGTIDECMRDVEGSYYRKFTDWKDPSRTNLELISNELGLNIEVIANELSSNYMQHIVIDNGEIQLNHYEKLFRKATDNLTFGQYKDRVEEINQFTI